MKLSEIKGERALDVLADLIEPAALIMADPKIKAYSESKKPLVGLIGQLIKGHKKEVLKILAVLEGEKPEVYEQKVNVFSLPAKLLDILNDPELKNLFTLQGQTTDSESSGSATASIGAGEQ